MYIYVCVCMSVGLSVCLHVWKCIFVFIYLTRLLTGSILRNLMDSQRWINKYVT